MLTDGQTDRQTDRRITKLIIAFRNSANAPKIVETEEDGTVMDESPRLFHES
jgi:hypothetical protein